MMHEIQQQQSDEWAEFTISTGSIVSYAGAAKRSSHTLTLKELPAGETPRERLLQSGASSLSNTELLALLIGSGNASTGESAIALAHRILMHLQSNSDDAMRLLREIKPEMLMQLPGIGEAKSATITAAIELGRRLFLQPPPIGTTIDDPAIAVQVLSRDLMFQAQEQFAVLFMNIKHQLIGQRVISVGSSQETFAHPCDVFREAIRIGASRIIVAHNHPSGNTTPSAEDLQLTEQLIKAGELLELPVLDHVILGNGSWLSLRQSSSLWSGVATHC